MGNGKNIDYSILEKRLKNENPLVVGRCTRKRRYATRHKAVIASHKLPTKGMKVYKCSFCKGYHLTSMNQNIKKQPASKTKNLFPKRVVINL